MGQRFNGRHISAAELLRRLHYNPITGVFTYRYNGRGPVKKGAPAGNRQRNGRWYLKIDGRTMVASRWAWLYCHGYLPPVEIDHVDNDKSNDSVYNLRLCIDGGVNIHNLTGPMATSKLGVLGVSIQKGMFKAQIQVDKEKISLGYYASSAEAYTAYVKAKRRYHKFGML